MSLFRAAATVGSLTMLSRVLGFVREILSAELLGAGPIAEAWVIALRVPNVFRRLFAEGAFSVAFVPVFSATRAEQGLDGAGRLAEEAQAALLAVLIPLTILGVGLMPWIVRVVALGFEPGTERYDDAVALSRITFPYLALVSITALQGGVLNGVERYGPFAFAQVLFNVCLIAGLIATPLFPNAGYALAWGEFAAGIVQVIWMAWACRANGIPLRLRWPAWTASVRRVFRLMGPAAIGTGAVQINVYVDTTIASFLPDGAVAWLYYADRLYQLPLGVVGIAVSTALLPMLVRALKSGDEPEARDLQSRAIEAALLPALPAAVALLVAGGPIVSGLFQHGKFGPADALATAGALAGYAAGIPAYVLAKVLSTAFFAREDTKTPVRFTLITVACNATLAIALSLILAPRGLGHVGIAAATAVTSWLNVALLARGLARRGLLRWDARLARFVPRALLATLAMAVAVAGIAALFAGAWTGPVLQRAVALTALVGGGGAAYALALLALGAVRAGDLKGLLRR